MISYYKTIDGKIEEIKEYEQGCWVNCIEPEEEEVQFLLNKFMIPPELMRSALDEEESSHIDSEGVTVVGVVFDMGIDTFEDTAEELLVGRLRRGDNTPGIVGSFLMVFNLDALAVLNDVVDTQFEVFEAEGLREILVGSEAQGLLLVFLLCLGGKEDDGQMAVVGIAFDGLRELVTVLLGHHHVGDDEVEFFLMDDVECLTTVLGGIDVVGRLQQLSHEHEELGIVFDDEQTVDVLVVLGRR